VPVVAGGVVKEACIQANVRVRRFTDQQESPVSDLSPAECWKLRFRICAIISALWVGEHPHEVRADQEPRHAS
jgi:hypothetical protein